MNPNEKLYDAVTQVRDELVTQAGAHKCKSKRHRPIRWAACLAAVLALAIAVGSLVLPGSPGSLTASAIATAEYPEMAQYPNEQSLNFNAEYDAWWEDIRAQRQGMGHADGLEGFWTDSIQALLGEEDGANKVCSPVNLYLALCMLAELTDGESRAQILDALGYDSIDAARQQANQVWNANYRNDGATTSILASSLWLNEHVTFQQSTLDALAEHYYASSYQGEMGSQALNQALQTWLNEQTKGLLSDQTGDIELDADTILALAVTVAFQAKWNDEFLDAYTREDIFHGAGGDTTAQYMHQSRDQDYYWGDQFAAISRYLENCDAHMWFILPDEGISPEALLQDEQVLDFIANDGEGAQSNYLIVNQSIPKFDVSGQIALEAGMKALGITDVFDPACADFSATTEREDIYLSQAIHGARVAIDEEGVTAAAYTVMVDAGAGEPPAEEVDFVLERPFLFVITGADGVPLFVGIVNQI